MSNEDNNRDNKEAEAIVEAAETFLHVSNKRFTRYTRKRRLDVALGFCERVISTIVCYYLYTFPLCSNVMNMILYCSNL